MIQNDIVNSFISKITQIRNGKFSDQISNTRDVFDARLMTFTSRTNNWLLGAVVGEVGANTFDHNFMFRSDYYHDGCFCIISTKGEM